MKEWILSIATVVLLTTIIGLILPEGKMGKFIKSIFSILTMLVIIKPVIYLKNGSIDYNEIVGTDNIVMQNSFLDYVFNKRVENHAQNCKKIIEEKGVLNADVNIEYLLGENQSINIIFVKINLQNAVINSDKQHIHIKEEIITDISSYLGVKKDLVIINE